MNRRMKIGGGILLLSLTVLTACGSSGQQSVGQSNKDQTETMNMNMDTDQANLYSIEFSTDPAEIHAGQEIKLIEKVSQKGKPITDATVEMEIWRDGEKNHKMVPSSGGQDGNYNVYQSFPDAGTYHVTLHTTANTIHQMPTKELQVQSAK